MILAPLVPFRNSGQKTCCSANRSNGAEKRRSTGTGPSMLGVGPGHPRLGHPFSRRFSDLRRRVARRIRCRSTFPGPNEDSESDKAVLTWLILINTEFLNNGFGALSAPRARSNVASAVKDFSHAGCG
jgi:hypothetical protein